MSRTKEEVLVICFRNGLKAGKKSSNVIAFMDVRRQYPNWTHQMVMSFVSGHTIGLIWAGAKGAPLPKGGLKADLPQPPSDDPLHSCLCSSWAGQPCDCFGGKCEPVPADKMAKELDRVLKEHRQ